jgi:uncharacterized protein (TIGR02271 family)
MQQALDMDRLTAMRGQSVYDAAGDKIGTVEEIFYDNETGQAEWIGIGTGFLRTKRVLVPVAGASVDEDGISVRYDKDQVKDSPAIDGDEIDEASELELYRYYGIQPSERASDSVLPEGGMAAGYASTGTADLDRQADLDDVGDRSLTRSEEELRVGKREVEAGRVRLRKWVETEPVETSVELEHETVHVHRERIDQPVSGAELGEQTIEATVRAEEPVVEKQVVARERVSLDKDVDVEERTVSDEVRRERIEVEGDVRDDATDRR